MCGACGAPLAADQRYCLQCGERRAAVSSFLRDGSPAPAGSPAQPAPRVPPTPPIVAGRASAGEGWARNNTLSVIAGVGVLLLAMGVGVLIGRSSSSGSATRTQVITLGSVPSTGPAGGAAETTFTSDWPASQRGYTIQLQALPEAGTTPAAVEQAKSSASAQGATGVGALQASEFSTLTAGSYIVYSGHWSKRAEAHKALSSLAGKFPGAKVIHVAGSRAAGGGAGKGAGKGASTGAGGSIDKPAPPSVLEGESHSKGKSYVEKSKELPDVVET